jgi:hypothetical protein
MAFYGIPVNCIIQKSKSKLSFSQFSLVKGFFEGKRENILHIFRASELQIMNQAPFLAFLTSVRPKFGIGTRNRNQG